MANIVKVTVKAEDKASGPMRRIAKLAKGDLSGSMRGLGKTVLGTAGGFIAAQASMAAVSSIMTKSIGAAMKYEHQMAQIRALTGATEEDTAALDKSIMDMARTMPKSPAELGAGAYFILSSGIEDAADAAEVLEVAARASTIGLGETSGVANALTTVLNAYGMSADKAGHVTDVMIQAVKEGKAEAADFAGVLGRVVPLAAQMGISFEEVSANLATFTRLGVSADEAATGLRQVMASLLKPSKQAEEAMQELGFSAEGLRKQIREEGLLATLDAMTKATGGNEAAVAKLFPNIRALTSVLGTAGVQMEGYTDILSATNNATGNLDEGFSIIADTTQHKVQMAMQELNLALMELGETALPLVAQSAEVLADVLAPLAVTVEGLNKSLDTMGLELGDIINLRGGIAGLAIAEGFKAASGGVTKAGQALGIFSKQTEKGIEVTAEATRQWAAFDQAMAKVDNEAYGLADTIDTDVVPSLEAIAKEADTARSALTSMFRETTAEEADAELALAKLKLEAGELEGKTGELMAAESARLALLNDELIPAQQSSLDLLRLQRDAVEKGAIAQDKALPSMEALADEIAKGAANVDWLNVALGKVPSTIDVKVALGLASTAELDLIRQAIALQMPVIPMQHGGAVETTRPTLFLASERRQKEGHIFTPGGLPQGAAGGRTISLTVNFQGPVLGDRRQAQEFAQWVLPEIERALV